MELVRERAKLPELRFYWARHSFATIARNKCRINKDDIIEKDWSIVDEVQAAVMNFIRDFKNPPLVPVRVHSVAGSINPEEQRKTMRLVSA